MKELTHHLLSIPFMLVGSTGVLTFVHYLNQTVEAPRFPRTPSYVQMMTAKPPKKQKPKRPLPTHRARHKAPKEAPKLAPIPNLASPISGADFNIPGYAPTDIAALSDGADLTETSQPSSMVMTEDSVDQPAKPVRQIPPRYPDEARARGVTGYVTLKMKIDEDGRVQQLRVTDTEPKGVFDQSALDAVRGWEFSPALYGGEPVAMWAVQTLRFQLMSRP